MIYKVGVAGATGRMGLEICSLISEEYLGKLEVAECLAESNKISYVEGVPVRALTEMPREPVHVWIDFSAPDASIELLKQIDTPVVLGTTGFNAAQIDAIKAYATKHAVVQAANMSPGVAVLKNWIAYLPEPTGNEQVIVTEEHHRHKKDSPSGTAKAILACLKEAGYSDPQVQVVRAGTAIGEHSVRWVSDYEELEIRHVARDRKVFAVGAVRAAEFLLRAAKPGIYSMDDVLKENA